MKGIWQWLVVDTKNDVGSWWTYGAIWVIMLAFLHIVRIPMWQGILTWVGVLMFAKAWRQYWDSRDSKK